MGSILTIMSTTESCQPHHHQVVGRERVNSDLKTLGATPCVFAGKVASVVAEVGSLFPRLRASICKSSRQNVHGLHRTVARAPIALENVLKKIEGLGALLEDEVGTMRTIL